VDVSEWAGTDDTLTLTVHDVGDTIYDTIILLDDITLGSNYAVVQSVQNTRDNGFRFRCVFKVLPHHRTYGSRIRRFGWSKQASKPRCLSQLMKLWESRKAEQSPLFPSVHQPESLHKSIPNRFF